jgi:hypothetical protein
MGALPALARTHFELARALVTHDRAAEAQRHAREALRLFEAAAMASFADRAQRLCAEIDSAAKPITLAHRAPPAIAQQCFLLQGEFWQLSYRGHVAQVGDLKGMHFLAALLTDPGRPIHVVELILHQSGAGASRPHAAADGEVVHALEGYETALDATSLARYRARVRELTNDLDDADDMNDLARKLSLSNELEFLERELLAGAKARHRPTERARKSVYNCIHLAIEHIDNSHADLARHLVRTIKTGTSCVYRPEDECVWTTA